MKTPKPHRATAAELYDMLLDRQSCLIRHATIALKSPADIYHVKEDVEQITAIAKELGKRSAEPFEDAA